MRTIRKNNVFILTVISLLMVNLKTNSQSVASPRWGKIWKAPNKDTYAVAFAGAIHIGPAENHPTNLDIDYASVPALEDALLFVEEGIATENMTYIFETDWDEWPDYVFNDNYPLTSLEDLETYIQTHKHLPGVITQLEVKNKGVSDKEMNITLLKKIEELTLYTIEQHNAIKAQNKLNTILIKRLEALEEQARNTRSNK